jgi:hypothetical protein
MSIWAKMVLDLIACDLPGHHDIYLAFCQLARKETINNSRGIIPMLKGRKSKSPGTVYPLQD